MVLVNTLKSFRIIAEVIWLSKTDAVHAQRAIFSHVLLASLYRNCQIGIRLVSLVQIPVETILEKLFTAKLKICPQQTACKSGTEYLRQN